MAPKRTALSDRLAERLGKRTAARMIKQRLKQTGATQKGLGQHLHRSAAGINHLLSGDYSELFSADEIERVASTLGLSGADRDRLLRCLGYRDDVPTNLPARLSSFIGREDERTALIQRLAEPATRLLTLTGDGGVGKTRLALEVARDLLRANPDGVWLVELAAVADDRDVLPAVARAIGVRDTPGRPLSIDTVIDRLKPSVALLIVDNCEHLRDACAKVLIALLKACPELTVVATSREPLFVPGALPSAATGDGNRRGTALARRLVEGQVIWQVPGLSFPPPQAAGALTPDGLTTIASYEAVQLFVERARAAKQDFALTSTNAGVVAEICRRLEGRPLAIEIAAARVRQQSVAEILRGLDHSFRLIRADLDDRGSDPIPERHWSLAATLDWSSRLLEEPDRALFRRLAVFAGGWVLEAAETICAGDPVPKDEVGPRLDKLVDASLVVADTSGDAARYRLLEPVREYATDQLDQAGESAIVRGRHRDWYAALGEEVKPQLNGPAQVEWFDRLDEEQHNAVLALQWSLEHGEVSDVLPLAASMGWFWYVRGRWDEGRRWLDRVLTATPAVPPPLRPDLLRVAGGIAEAQGDLDAATAYFAEALRITEATGDERGQGMGFLNLGIVAYRRGAPEQAEELFIRALGMLTPSVDPAIRARALINLAAVWFLLRRYRDAKSALKEALDLLRPLDDRRSIASALLNLALVHLRFIEIDEAVSRYEEALQVLRELKDRANTALALNQLGSAETWRGNHARAWESIEESLAIRRELGDARGIANTAINLGILAVQTSQHERAGQLLDEALNLGRALNDAVIVRTALENQGWLAAVRGEHPQATLLFQESLAQAHPAGDNPNVAGCLAGLALVAYDRGHWRRAARLLGAAHARRALEDAPPSPIEREWYDRVQRRVLDALGAATFARAAARGAAMSAEVAVAYACRIPASSDVVSGADDGARAHRRYASIDAH
jgi:predicted ATPase